MASSMEEALRAAGAVPKKETPTTTKKQPQNNRSAGGGRKYGEIVNAAPAERPAEIATAPYNFVPLPRNILPSELDAAVHDILVEGSGESASFKQRLTKEEDRAFSEAFGKYLQTKGRFSGRIDLAIESLTPLFLGGTGTRSFAPTGRPIIPGSELRGMFRSLFKTVTCGSWHQGEDMSGHHLYYRCLMSTKASPYNKDLHERYTAYMTGRDEQGNVKKNARPGFLVKRGAQWLIYPLLKEVRSIPIFAYQKMFNLLDDDIKKSKIRWAGRTAYIQIGLLSTKKLKRSKEELERASPDDRKTWGKQYYKYLCVDDLDASKCYEVPVDVIEEYIMDGNRRGVNLLEQKSKGNGAPLSLEGIASYDELVPCFFFLDASGQVKSFGHGQSYRIPYDHSMMNAVPEGLQRPVIDFADAVFGCSRAGASWASRVIFEDAAAVSVEAHEKRQARALMQPNPTAFQLYLRQSDGKKLIHWDFGDRAEIRGHKMYWHNADCRWYADEKERANLSQNRDENAPELLKEMAPLKTGAKFQGRIRFRDLTEVELGALLKVLFLAQGGEEIAYKIGMGKSLGLGSIRIVPQLFLEDGTRYRRLFDADAWHTSEQPAYAQELIAAYENFAERALDGKLASSYRNIVTVMCYMMDFGNTKKAGWNQATAQMDGDTKQQRDMRFRNRNILPEAKVIRKKMERGWE